MVSFQRGTRTLRKFGIEPGQSYRVRDIGQAVEAFYRTQYGAISRHDTSPATRNKIARWMADEITFAVEAARKNPGSSAVGWYSTKFQRALDMMATAFPELTGDMDASLPGVARLENQKNARDLLTAIIAITSDGAKVQDNLNQAAALYDQFRRTRVIPTTGTFGGQRVASFSTNLRLINELMDEFGPAGMHQHLLRTDTVGNLKRIAKEQGKELTTEYQAHITVPLAALEFGPKLGAFYANLMGQQGYLTMDRWWSRTFNRYRGQLLPKPTRQSVDRLKQMLGDDSMTDEQAFDATGPIVERLKDRGFKTQLAEMVGQSQPTATKASVAWMKKAEELAGDSFPELLAEHNLERAANTINKKVFDQLEDSPFRASDRTFMVETAKRAQSNLRRRGIDMSVADIQAVLWYFEKQLYSNLGARESAQISYEEAAAKAAERVGPDAQSERSDVGAAGERSEPAGSLNPDEAGGVTGNVRYSIAEEGVDPPRLSFPADSLPDNIKVVPTHDEAAAAVFENGQGTISQEHAGADAEMLALQMAGFGQSVEAIIGGPFARRLERMEGTLGGIVGDSALRQDPNVQNALRRTRKHLQGMGIEATDQQAAWYLQGVAMSPEGRFVVPVSPNLNTGQGRQIGDPIPEAYDPEKDFPILRDKRGPMLAWTRFFESAADNFEQTSGLEYLGQPIRDYFDGELKYKAEALNILRPALQAFGRLPGRLREFVGLAGSGPTQKQAETAFGNYFKAVTYGGDAQAVYDRAPQVAKDLIDAWRKVGEMTGDMNQQLGVQVKDGNKWRPIGRVPIYFPRMLSDDTRATLANPAKNPEHWNRLVDALMAGDYIKSRDEAVEYIKAQAVPTESQNDYFSAMEAARKQALPDVFYDWSIVPALKYVDAWATRYSQIEQFGQATDTQKDLFDQALDSGVLDEHTRKYIKAAQKRIYEYAAVNGWQTALATFNMIATGSQLANYGTAYLNLIGGSTLNWMTYGEIAALKAYGEIIRHPFRSFKDMREIGVLREDFLKIFQDHGEDRIFSIFGKSVSPSRALSRAVTLLMKYGGYLPTEHVIRMHGGLTGKHYLLRARKAYADNPSSRRTRQFRAFVERNNFDFDRLMREDGKYFEKWLRFTSNLTQGTYRIDQSPIYTDIQEGRFFLKYQKFGTQVNRLVWKESLEPFVKSTVGKGELLSTGERVRTFMPMVRFFYAAAAGGAAIGFGRQQFFDYMRRGPQEDELEEALKDDDRARKLAVLFAYAYHQMNTAGAFGFIGNYAQMFRDFTQQERVKNPLDPPGLAALDAAEDIATKLIGQGEYSLRDMDETLERFFSLYRTSKRPLIKALGLVDEENRLYKIQSAERDRKYIAGVTSRFAKDQGIEGARSMMGGRFMPSEITPISKSIIDSIRAGDHGRARAIYREALRDAGEDRRKVQNSVRASVRNAQPMKMHGKVMSEREQREFLRWARDHVGAENYERIQRAHQDYVRAASRAGVM